MAHPRDLLQRFRFAGSPGAATGRGVPADRAAEAAAELTPLLALLDPAQEEAKEIRAAGRAQAEQVRRDAQAQAQAQLATARATAATVQAQAAAEVADRANAAQVSGRSAAREEAQRVREHATARMPAYVDRVVAAVVSALAEDQP